MTNQTDEEIWEARGDKYAHEATVHPGWFIAKVGVVVLLIALLLGTIGFFAGWFSTGVKIISPENVKQQYALAFQDYNSLKSTAQNVCAVKDAEAGLDPNSSAYQQRETERLGYVVNYDRVKAEYEARMQNIFQAKKVKPAELPFTAPTLPAMEAQVC